MRVQIRRRIYFSVHDVETRSVFQDTLEASLGCSSCSSIRVQLATAISFPTRSSEGLGKNMADRVKEVAAEEAERLKTLTSEAVRSKAYLYPIKV
jgi:hypothetical protein